LSDGPVLHLQSLHAGKLIDIVCHDRELVRHSDGGVHEVVAADDLTTDQIAHGLLGGELGVGAGLRWQVHWLLKRFVSKGTRILLEMPEGPAVGIDAGRR